MFPIRERSGWCEELGQEVEDYVGPFSTDCVSISFAIRNQLKLVLDGP